MVSGRGIEEHLADGGFRYFFTDAHLAQAGGRSRLLRRCAASPRSRFDARAARTRSRPGGLTRVRPYEAYRVSAESAPDNPWRRWCAIPTPRLQVWSRDRGYPGDGAYLEFHKIRWPGGLKFWRVTGPKVDLGAKRPYEPATAFARAADHAAHFAHLLANRQDTGRANRRRRDRGAVRHRAVGHWWFEGLDFLGAMYRRLMEQAVVRPVTAGQHLEQHPPRAGLRLAEGSWGANGDHTMWMNRSYRLDVAPALGARGRVLGCRPRGLRLARPRGPCWRRRPVSCCWHSRPTGNSSCRPAWSPTTAIRRFNLHCQDAEPAGRRARARRTRSKRGSGLAEELWNRDGVFPDILAERGRGAERVTAPVPLRRHSRSLLPAAPRRSVARRRGDRAFGGAVSRLERAYRAGVLPRRGSRSPVHPGRADRADRQYARLDQFQFRADARSNGWSGTLPRHLRRDPRGRPREQRPARRVRQRDRHALPPRHSPPGIAPRQGD